MIADSYLPCNSLISFQLVEVAIRLTRSFSTNLAFDHQSTLMASILAKGLLTTFACLHLLVLLATVDLGSVADVGLLTTDLHPTH